MCSVWTFSIFLRACKFADISAEIGVTATEWGSIIFLVKVANICASWCVEARANWVCASWWGNCLTHISVSERMHYFHLHLAGAPACGSIIALHSYLCGLNYRSVIMSIDWCALTSHADKMNAMGLLLINISWSVPLKWIKSTERKQACTQQCCVRACYCYIACELKAACLDL